MTFCDNDWRVFDGFLLWGEVMDGICRADVSEPWCTLIRLKRCSIIGAVHRAARRPGQKREQEEAATWAFGAVLGLRSVRFTVPRMSGAYIAKPSAKLFVCAAQSHPLSSCDWLASDNRMRGGARHRLTDTHSLYVRGKNRENGPDSEWWEVGTFVTVASLSLPLSLSSSSPLLIADQQGSADLIYLDINQRTVLEYPSPLITWYTGYYYQV